MAFFLISFFFFQNLDLKKFNGTLKSQPYGGVLSEYTQGLQFLPPNVNAF